MTKLWRFLSSLALGVWCGLGLAVLLAISSIQLIYQSGLDNLGGPPLLYWLAGRHNLASVWWILGLLAAGGLFLLNIICCTVESLRRIIPGILRPLKTDMPLSEPGIHSRRPAAEAARQAERLLRKLGFRILSKPTVNGLIISGDRGRWWLISSHAAHIGLIILLIGLTISAASGYKRSGVKLRPGKWQPVAEADFSLRLADKNNIEINRAGSSSRSPIPKINQPVFSDDVSLHLSGKGEQIQKIVLKIRDGPVARLIRLEAGEESEIKPGIKVILPEIIPDFRLGADSRAASASSEYNNPAALIRLEDHGRLAEEKWFFVRYPSFSRTLYKNLDIRLHSAEWTPYINVDIVRNPGTGTALTGGILLVLGWAWNLLGGFKQIYLSVTPADPEGSLIAFGGSSETIAKLQETLKVYPDEQ